MKFILYRQLVGKNMIIKKSKDCSAKIRYASGETSECIVRFDGEKLALYGDILCSGQRLEFRLDNGLYLFDGDGITTVFYLNKSKCDNISPSHYKVGGIETWDYLKAKMSTEALKGFAIGNCLKYLSRAEHKNGLEDMKKCKWYLDKIIAELGDK